MIKNILVNKKAQIFAVLAIFLVALTFASFELFSFIHKQKSTQERVSTMDSFLSSLEKNLERQVYISGFRIIFLAEKEVLEHGYIGNITSFFQEAYFNGTVNGVPNEILNGANYTNLIESINNKANKISVDVTITNPVIFVNQPDPWTVNFTLVSDFIMSDISGLASWRKKQTISALIPITYFEDPIFVRASPSLSRKIIKTAYDNNYSIQNLQDHVIKGYYSNNTDAPNFLMRLEGNFSSDPNGIESFVNVPDLVSLGLMPKSKTLLDYIYFSNSNPSYCTVNPVFSWFRIDNQDNHYAKYNITTIQPSCP